MDIPRESQTRRKIIIRIIFGVVILAAIGAVSFHVSKMEPAAPAVDRATVWIDTHDPRYAKRADRTINLFDGCIVDGNQAAI